MALQIYGPGDFVPDPGDNGRVYPILDKPDDTEIMYDDQIQKVSHIQANLVAIFHDWILSFFDPNYFTFSRIKTQSTFTAFKTFMRDIYKKDKPFMVIDPRPPEIVEDSIFAQNMLNRYNLIDPTRDNIGAKLLYSLQVMESDLFELWYRRNRIKIEFDIMIMEETMNRQEDTFNRLLMNIRHNSKFMLYRTVPYLLPMRHIRNIANLYGMNWKSEEFLELLNKISRYPIIRRIQPNGKYMFFMQNDLHIQVEVPGFPDKDDPEKSEAIELGARVVDRFLFIADMPAEFLFLTKKEHVGKFDLGIQEDPDDLTFISPIYADMNWPKEINGYTLSNRLDIEVQEGDEPTLKLLPLILDFDKDIHSVIMEWITHKGDIADLMTVRVYPNGSMREVGAILHNDGVLELTAPKFNKLYTANIYLNLKTINLIREGKNKKYIGNIEKH